ncbi:TPA: hypothetical protein IB181_000023 [Escherichia coli]|nr:hypothetical protein [Escherichia coli]HBD2156837.1 hypothetical protein [Escherichia coli]
MSNIISVIQNCIDPAFQLTREQACWVIFEDNPSSANKKLLVNGNGVYGFSLDSTSVSKPVWKFLKSSTLTGLSSVCDGIFVTSYRDMDYFIVIDLKSYNSNRAAKQIVTGIHFCKWLYSVLKLHGHLSRKVGYIGVISKLSRRMQSNKRTTVRSPLPEPEVFYDYPVFTLENYSRLTLTGVCEVIYNMKK